MSCYETDTPRMFRPSRTVDDRLAPTQSPTGVVFNPRGVDLLAYRSERGLDLWTGMALVSENARQWLRLRFGLDPDPPVRKNGEREPEELTWISRVYEIVKVDPVALKVTVRPLGGKAATYDLPAERVMDGDDEEAEAEAECEVTA